MYANGLPEDVEVNEIVEYFKKCGRIAKNVEGDFKIKLYQLDGKPKGDCRVCYENVESVDMAIEILNQSHFRPNVVISVEPASF